MGQPIYLTKGDEKMTVYGAAQAAVHRAQGWQFVNKDVQAAAPKADDLTELGISEEIAGSLANLGYITFEDVAEAPVDKLLSVKGIGKKTAASLKATASELI